MDAIKDITFELAHELTIRWRLGGEFRDQARKQAVEALQGMREFKFSYDNEAWEPLEFCTASSFSDELRTGLLYHYCSTEAFHSIITSGTIRLSLLTMSNDSMECRHFKHLLMKQLKSEAMLKSIGDPSSEIIAYLAHEIEGAFGAASISGRDDIYGISLSKEGNLLSQWRAYADSGRGFAIGLDPSVLTDLAHRLSSGLSLQLSDVCYREEDFLERVKTIFETLLLWKETPPTCPTLGYPTRAISGLIEHNSYICKSEFYRDEREVRYFTVNPDPSRLSYRPAAAKLVPYLEIKLPHTAIRHVYIGPTNKTPPKVVDGFLNSNYWPATVSISDESYRS